MYLRRLLIQNVRAISSALLEFRPGEEAGWHVILGANGAGKSAIIKSIALTCMGERESYASRQDFRTWIRAGEEQADISGSFLIHKEFDELSGSGQLPQKPVSTLVEIEVDDWEDHLAEIRFSGERHSRTIWGGGNGWFSASFGPFRRFTGGDRVYDRLFVSNKRLAPHLTALGEDVALTEAFDWLSHLHSERLQDERNNSPSKAGIIVDFIVDFFNRTNFLPHNAKIEEIYTKRVYIKDGVGKVVPIDQLSDGYRSALSLTVELIRQMFELYPNETVLKSFDRQNLTINLPGLVAIDEIDAHLHPTWQQRIGRWLTKHFPHIQFIVTTHSPIVCRSIVDSEGSIKGSAWLLPTPGNEGEFRRITDDNLNSLIYGDILDAYGTSLFGDDIEISEHGHQLRARLAQLNLKAIDSSLSEREKEERKSLKRIFSSNAI